MFASSLEGVKFISLGKLSFENVMFYHYYFRDNKGLFIEAPVCCQTEAAAAAAASSQDESETTLKNVRVYTACLNHSFFYSIKYLFDAIVGKKNVIFKSESIGHAFFAMR